MPISRSALNDLLPVVQANLQRRMSADSPTGRPTPGQLLRHSFFANKEFVVLLSFIESFSLKDEDEKVRMYKYLRSIISLCWQLFLLGLLVHRILYCIAIEIIEADLV